MTTIQAQYFAILSGHNHDFYSTFEEVGTGPRWVGEKFARRFETEADAQAQIDNMHPDYRARLKPEIVECLELDTGEIAVS